MQFSGKFPRAAILTALIVLGCFWFFAGDGLRAYFTADDMMNLYNAGVPSPAKLVSENVLFFTGAYRPMGLLFYRVLFALFGLNPLPYRAGCLALLLANLGLLYVFCARLTQSWETGAIACLIGAYHARLADLYYSTGTVYDLLCYLFLFLVLVQYIGIRKRGCRPGWGQTGGMLALYICALDAKEMAVALPVFVLVYEAIYHPPESADARALLRWMYRGQRFLWISVAATAAYIAGKWAAPDSMVKNPAYTPSFSFHQFLFGWQHYLFDLFYGHLRFNSPSIILLFLGMLLLALAFRDRHLLFAWSVIVIGALPVIFSPPRGLYVMYTTLPGWYLFGARTVLLARTVLVRAAAVFSDMAGLRTEQVVSFLALLVFLAPVHSRQKRLASPWGGAQTSRQLEALQAQLAASHPSLPRGAKVLFLSDPFKADDWILTFAFRLHYRDPNIDVDRVKKMSAPPGGAALARYCCVFAFDGRTLRDAPRLVPAALR